MRLVGRFWFDKLCRLCLGLVAVSIAMGMIGCGVKSPNAKKNIGDNSAQNTLQRTSQNTWQNTAKVTINISSQINGLNKSVLTYWCKAQEKSSQEKSVGDKDDKNSKADMPNSEQDLTPQSTQSSKDSELESSPNDLKNAQDSSLQDSAPRDSHKSHSELDSQANSSYTPQNPSKLDISTSPKCKAIGGANAFFRALKTSRFRAPRDEVVELEAGVYYLAAFEIEAKRHILRSCSEEASKCGGYEGGKPRFLAFRVNSGENLILPKVIILPKTRETNLASDFEDSAKSKEAKATEESDKRKESKRAKKSKNDEPKELIFVILEDFGKQESENLPHKAESKRGNAIFSLGSGVSFEFSTLSDKDNKNEATPNHKNLNQKDNDTSQSNTQSTILRIETAL